MKTVTVFNICDEKFSQYPKIRFSCHMLCKVHVDTELGYIQRLS